MTDAERNCSTPCPGAASRRRAHGVDLTLLVERLRLSPEERVRDLQRAAAGLEAMRGRARRPLEERKERA